ncbi:MAG: acylglycerol kinase family protein, partial [Oscillospiraceae bacterium]
MKYVFIVNPKSGKKEASGYVIPLIEAYFKGKNLDYEIKITQYAKHATQLAREAASENEQVRICSCGGDGTLSEVAAGLVGFDNAEFACFPCGSGNDYIKYFGTANDFSNIEQVVLGKSKVVDILRINDTYCLNLLSVGIDADVASYIPRIRRMPLV